MEVKPFGDETKKLREVKTMIQDLFARPIIELRNEVLHAIYDRVASLAIPGQIIRNKELFINTIYSERYLEPVTFRREVDGIIKASTVRNSDLETFVIRVFFHGDPKLFEFYPDMELQLPKACIWGSNLLEFNLPVGMDENEQAITARRYLNEIDRAIGEINREARDINICLPETTSLAIEMYNLSLGYREGSEEFSRNFLYF